MGRVYLENNMIEVHGKEVKGEGKEEGEGKKRSWREWGKRIENKRSG